MKIAKTRFDYIFLIYVPFALIGILLNIFFTNEIVAGLKWFSLVTLILTIICILTPFARQKLLSNSLIIKQKSNHWFGKLLLLQLGIIFTFLGFSQAIADFIASNNNNQTATHLLQQTINFYQGGLWPWPFILLVSCAISYLGRTEKYPALLRKSVQPVIKKYADNIIGVGIEIFLKQGLLFTSLLTIGILTLQIAHIISQLLHLPSLLIFSLHTAIISFLLLILLAQNKFIYMLSRWLWQQNHSDNKLILICCFIILLGLVIFNCILYLISTYLLPTNLLPIQLPPINKLHNINQWLLLSFIWWLGIMPLLTRTIAIIGRERRLSEILCAGLLLPIILSAGWQFGQHYLISNHLPLITSWPIALTLSISSLLITAYLFHNPNTCHITSDIKACHTSERSTITFLRTLWQLCTSITATYLLTNLILITLLGSALAAPIFATLFSSILGCLITLLKRSASGKFITKK